MPAPFSHLITSEAELRAGPCHAPPAKAWGKEVEEPDEGEAQAAEELAAASRDHPW
jgi:hypothetical protein